MPGQRREALDRNLHIPCNHGLHCGRSTAKRYVRHVEFRFGANQFHHKMRGAALSGRREIDPALLAFHPGSKLGNRGRRDLGVHHHHLRKTDQHRHRDKVFLRIVGQRLEQPRVDRHGAGRPHQECFPIGPRACGDLGADVARCTGAVLDDELHVDVLGQAGSNQPRHHIHRRSGSKGIDESYRPCGPVLRKHTPTG